MEEATLSPDRREEEGGRVVQIEEGREKNNNLRTAHEHRNRVILHQEDRRKGEGPDWI